jgi:hypothetical protein
MLRFLWKIKHGGARYEVAAATIGAAVVGGAISANAAGDAADAQAAASDRASAATTQAQREATALQRYMYDTSRNDQLPYLQRGNVAGNVLQYLLGLSTSKNGPSASSQPAAAPAPYTLDDFRAYNARIAPVGYSQAGQESDAQVQYRAYQNGEYGNDAAAIAQRFGFTPPAVQQTSGMTPEQELAAAQADPAYGSLMRRFTVDDLKNDVPYQQGFQYALDQGQLGVNRLAAASGSLNSGATLKALQDRAANVANQYAGDAYNRFTSDQTNQYNRLAGISGAGQQAANSLASSGANYANAGTSTALSTGNALSNLYTGAGNSRAASSIAGGNALSGGLNSISNYYQTQNLLSRLGGLSGNTGAGGMYGSRGVFSTSDFKNPSGR